MTITLEEILADHPVDRAAVDAHKKRMLEAIDEARREDDEQTSE